jgi:hypothetical protein
LARAEAPGVAHRRALRACAAIGAARPEGVLDPAAIGWTRWSILRLGEEAAAELAAIPDMPELQALDRDFAAAYPWLPGNGPPPVAQRMLRLIERYRRECGLDRLELDRTLAEIRARIDPPADRGPRGTAA